jgi:hypothetical protein
MMMPSLSAQVEEAVQPKSPNPSSYQPLHVSLYPAFGLACCDMIIHILFQSSRYGRRARVMGPNTLLAYILGSVG